MFNVYASVSLIDRFGFKVYPISGPSMMPTFNVKDDLVLLDCFTHRFLRDPKKGEMVICNNPHKENATLVKRVKFVEGETAVYMCPNENKVVKKEIPKNH